MNNSELMQEVENLKSRIEELEKELEKVGNEDEEKYPAEGTTIYFLNAFGSVAWDSWGGWIREDSSKCMKLLFDSGRIFLTEEAAEEFAEVQRVEDELFALADDRNKWDEHLPHYYLFYDYDSQLCNITYVWYMKKSIPYFASEESAKKAVETVGEERVIKWLTYKRARGNYK